MPNTTEHWLPSGAPQPLSIPFPGSDPVSLDLYLNLLGMQLQYLVDLDQKAARRALEMSQEQAPELWAIAEENPPSQWGTALVASDGLSRHLPQPWRGAKITPPDPLPSLEEVLEILA